MGRLQSTSTFGSFSNRFGKSKEAPSLEPPREERERPRSPLRTTSSINDNTGLDWPDVATPGPTETPGINGNASAASAPNGGYQNNDLTGLSLQQPLQPSAPTAAREITKETARDPMREASNVTDNEGYSQRPDTLDPITAAQMEASGERSEPQYNVNIKDAPVTQEAGDADALNTVANTLKMVGHLSHLNEILLTLNSKLHQPRLRDDSVPFEAAVRTEQAFTLHHLVVLLRRHLSLRPSLDQSRKRDLFRSRLGNLRQSQSQLVSSLLPLRSPLMRQLPRYHLLSNLRSRPSQALVMSLVLPLEALPAPISCHQDLLRRWDLSGLVLTLVKTLDLSARVAVFLALPVARIGIPI